MWLLAKCRTDRICSNQSLVMTFETAAMFKDIFQVRRMLGRLTILIYMRMPIACLISASLMTGTPLRVAALKKKQIINRIFEWKEGILYLYISTAP
jgi:hypothetical protein